MFYAILLGFMSMLPIELNEAPVLNINRDDHVATIEIDFDETGGHGSHLWNVGTDGNDPIGYLLQWWPDPSIASTLIAGGGCYTDLHTGTPHIATPENPHQLVSPNHMVQLQPIANNVTYYLRVVKLNSLGEECSLATTMTFQGGDGSRVQALASEMTFFDDFNLPEGQADELKWNNAHVPQTDPRFNLFFINKQCHTHTLNGTLNGAAGDKSQVAQRARKPILIEENTSRKIVFDMDGVFASRGVWYLDLNPVPTDITGHSSFFDQDGDTGLPADVFRIKARRQELSINLINSSGASYRQALVELPDVGRGMVTNVRRHFEIHLSTAKVEVFVDDLKVLEADFEPGEFKPGRYYPLWSTVGYNTSKDDNPYFLSHWDNFGFDGPDIEPYYIHNYVTQLIGTDLQKANSRSGTEPEFTIQVPDDIRPLEANVKNDVYLVFTYHKNDFSSFQIKEGDHVLVNGIRFELPEGANNTAPEVTELVNYNGSAITNRIKIDDVELGGASIIQQGVNTIKFIATNTGIVNLHVEVYCPETAPEPSYTPPHEIHPYHKHHDLPVTGPPVEIKKVDGNESVDPEADPQLVTEMINVEVLAGNRSWAGWAPHLLQHPAVSAEQWSTGNSQGLEKIEIFLRPSDNDTTYGYHIKTVETSTDGPAPQIRLDIEIDTRMVVNGEYELFAVATDAKGNKSHPAYDGFGFRWDVSELSGAFRGIPVSVNNEVIDDFTFHGAEGNHWTENDSWSGGRMPPYGYTGTITIDAHCEVPRDYLLEFESNAEVILKSGMTLSLQH